MSKLSWLIDALLAVGLLVALLVLGSEQSQKETEGATYAVDGPSDAGRLGGLQQ